ncbi:MAG TPA: TAT-variant-translocated molybdopterin oxidoreductase [Chthoniobacterales bacterium]|jgi:molybdopterin-containing oxidoreductase family iron-sulfur binding subunit|nr:TAT-variant-translocated molybdopterin oxidoreductase [Chthoniobacterales bacterium]
MKRIFEHPPETLTGKRYWRSLDEFSDTPEFRGWLEREFPAGAAQLNGDEWSRRGFLKLMGASMALAGFGLTSCRRPEAHLVPFTKSVEWTIPGKALYYATAMPRRTGAIPLIAATVDGRPIKLEGNPLHPASGGSTDTFAQASLLDLYDPARSKRFVQKGQRDEKGKKVDSFDSRDRAAFEKYLTELTGKIAADGGAGLAFLVEEVHSPTRERLRAELVKTFPKMRWCVYDPLLTEAQSFATQLSFGDNARLVPRFERADVVLALDSDFLDCGEGDLAGIRAFTSRRRVSGAKDAMNRLYVVENRYTLTGAMADHRLRCPASQIPAFTRALAGKIAVATKDQGLASTIATLTEPVNAMQFEDAWVTECANDLMAKPGASLVVAGAHQPVVVQLMVYAINAALKNVGATVIVREFIRAPKTNSILQLAGEINAGRIKQLFILGGDPVYNAPRGITIDRETKAPVDWPDLQRKVPDVVRLGYYEDATSELSNWHVPAAHYLESWSDALTNDGAYVAIQPMILPLFGGMSELDLLNAVLGRPKVEGPELVQETFRASAPPGDFQAAWSQLLRDGFATHVALKEKPPTFNANNAGGVAHTLWSTPPNPTLDAPEIVLTRSYNIDDGRYINNGWLQELPDPITKLTWDNAALISPAMAKHLGVATGDLINIGITETTKDAQGKNIRRELVIAAVVSPGHADNSISISLGYGRKKTGPIGEEAGFNAFLLRTSSNPHYIAVDSKTVEAISVTTAPTAVQPASPTATTAPTAAPKVRAHTLGKYPLSITQDHWSIEGRGLVREASLEKYREDPEFVKKIAGDEELPPKLPSLYSHPPLSAEQQWGMTVDLNVCTGCSACIVACQSENNIPIVGKLQVSHGRAMHWLRLDRYYASAKPFNQDRGEFPEDPELVHEPMMCQHCENAPCETVCPVNATVHSEDGLNVMAYNRCIGTRYCANNCPFKVRRFNYFDYNQRPIGKKKIGPLSVYQEYIAPFTEKGAPDTVKLQKNPNVTVRMRGVMEKCTYCVQRIEEAKIAAHVKAGASDKTRIPRDSFTTACAQVCPTEAIAFGDIKDPESKVSKIKAQDRNYRLLEYLNVSTRTSYLARIRNPNPKMPDAHRIGVASLGHHGPTHAETSDSTTSSHAPKAQHDFNQQQHAAGTPAASVSPSPSPGGHEHH